MGHLGIFEELEICNIDFPKDGLRINVGSIEGLASSIAQKGLLQPIVARIQGDRYEVVAGNRRLAACKLLKWRKIPAHVMELDDKESFEASLIENVQHRTLNPIEEAMAFKKYVEDFGWGGISSLAQKIGKSQEYVTRRIQLLQLPEKVQEKIISRRLGSSFAQELLNLDSKTAEKFSEIIEKEGLKRAQIRHVVKSIQSEGLNAYNIDPHADVTYEDVVETIDRALSKCITILKSALVRIDQVVSDFDEDWITKELLMQYRVIIHGDIDTFMRLRKKLQARLRTTYISSSEDKYDNNYKVVDETHIYPTSFKAVWQ